MSEVYDLMVVSGWKLETARAPPPEPPASPRAALPHPAACRRAAPRRLAALETTSAAPSRPWPPIAAPPQPDLPQATGALPVLREEHQT